MINTFIIEGKLKEISEVKETDKGIKYAHIVISVERNYRNSDGQFDEDLIEIELWRGIAEICSENSKVDDYVSIQGRIQSAQLKTNEGKPFIAYKFVAEKVSFLH